MNEEMIMLGMCCFICGILTSFIINSWTEMKTNPSKIELVGGPFDGEVLANRPAVTRSFIMIGFNEYELERYELQEDKAIYSPE